jgi:hypothetical protein
MIVICMNVTRREKQQDSLKQFLDLLVDLVTVGVKEALKNRKIDKFALVFACEKEGVKP